jgi:exodeoxyribonuclease VII large subunit
MQFNLFRVERPVWTVTDLTRLVRSAIETDPSLQNLWVRGEISNLSRPASGHLYFTLKDAGASLRCVMWRSEVERVGSLPREGEAVEVHGHVGVYEAAGQYQLYADSVRRGGEGALYQEFLRLKARLEAEGLFDPARKRPLPAWPSRIGIVTSPSGAAFRDVLTVLRRRFPFAEAILAPTPVQGEEAPRGIVAALRAVNRVSRPDVILLVRGGGSLEDLWAFNDEQVVRAVAGSAAPVVCGVGHDTDFVLADFAADLRAATPSAAAEIITPNRLELAAQVGVLRQETAGEFSSALASLRKGLRSVQAALDRASPRARLANARQRVDEFARRLGRAELHALSLHRSAVAGLSQALRAVGPPAVLARGYAVVTLPRTRTIVRSIQQIEGGETLDIRVSDGVFGAKASAPKSGDPKPHAPDPGAGSSR